MQRAKDLAEHAKVSMKKDKEIAELKKRIADLEAALANSVSIFNLVKYGTSIAILYLLQKRFAFVLHLV